MYVYKKNPLPVHEVNLTTSNRQEVFTFYSSPSCNSPSCDSLWAAISYFSKMTF